MELGAIQYRKCKCVSYSAKRPNPEVVGGEQSWPAWDFLLRYLFSRLPFCVLGGWGRSEDETLQIFTTWITKKLHFRTELFISLIYILMLSEHV